MGFHMEHHYSGTPLITRFMGPKWGPSGADRTQVGPMLAPWTLLSGTIGNMTTWYQRITERYALHWKVVRHSMFPNVVCNTERQCHRRFHDCFPHLLVNYLVYFSISYNLNKQYKVKKSCSVLRSPWMSKYMYKAYYLYVVFHAIT